MAATGCRDGNTYGQASRALDVSYLMAAPYYVRTCTTYEYSYEYVYYMKPIMICWSCYYAPL